MDMNQKRGKFITFEGPEGSGKSTQIIRLETRLKAAGHSVFKTREPGGTKTGEAIRAILQYDQTGENIAPFAELLMFAASRAQLVHQVIIPHLGAGEWVICDRFADSTTAYQGYGRGFDLDVIRSLNAVAMGAAIPDLTIILDLDVKIGFERLHKRGGMGPDRFEREALDFHERVRDGYLDMACKEPARFRIVEAEQSPEVVEEAIWKAVSDAFRG